MGNYPKLEAHMIIGGNRGPLMLVPVLLLLLFQGCTATKAPKKVLIIPREGSADLKMALTKEYMVMANGLREAGYSIEVATLSGRELKASTIGLTPDKKLSDVRTKDYAGIMMPCMNAGLGFCRQAFSLIPGPSGGPLSKSIRRRE